VRAAAPAHERLRATWRTRCRDGLFCLDYDRIGSNGSKAAILPLTPFDTQPYPIAAGNYRNKPFGKG
jgi:hypothetical protein